MTMSKIKVLATDGLDLEAQEKLKQSSGILLSVNSATPKGELVSALKEMDFAVIRSATVLNAEVLAQLPNLKGVLRAGVGIDNIDLKKAEELGIHVWNAPTGNFQATAELALALLFSLSRKIVFATEAARKGYWAKKEIGTSGRQMQGSTLGIFGAGNIGLRLAKMGSALGMKILVCDPVFKENPEQAFRSVTFDTLLAESDFISIHSPLLDSTKYKFNTAAFKKMKKGALLVNAARGGIICEADLLAALKEGLLGGVGLDVFEVEPFSADQNIISELLKHEKVIATPHVGAQTAESQKAVGLESADKILQVVGALNAAGTAPKALNVPQNPRWKLTFT